MILSPQKARFCTMTSFGTCPGAVYFYSILVILASVSVKQSHQKRRIISTVTSAGTCPCAVCLVGILVISVYAFKFTRSSPASPLLAGLVVT